MREYRFRAYSNKDKKMYVVTSLCFVDKIVYVDSGEYHRRRLTLKSIKLMQYTGLKDRNGKEICEGDIVEWPSGDRDFICYDEILCQFRIGKGSNSVQIAMNVGEERGNAIVVGNIYESPELLEKSE